MMGGFSTTTIFLICRHHVTDYFTFLLIILCHTCQFGCVIGRTFALKTKKDIKIQRKICAMLGKFLKFCVALFFAIFGQRHGLVFTTSGSRLGNPV